MHAFPATRTAALERLQAFVPHAGRDYASLRNFDKPGHPHVSTLSPYIKHRLITEEDVLRATLGRFSLSSAEKFVQEVYWRTYWKGWLEMRPSVWAMYKTGLNAALNRVQTESGLRQNWEAACTGSTEIECFNHWAHELVETGYMHNHARMWFASIWIFTLRLPWELGADFFLRHLLDGDAASNTLGWRWVAGIQTPGKTYLARASNISKFTEGRFHPKWQLAGEAIPVDAHPAPQRGPAPLGDSVDPAAKTILILTDDDLSPGYVLDRVTPTQTVLLDTASARSPLAVSANVQAFSGAARDDCAARYGNRLGTVTRLSSADLAHWLADQTADQVVTPFAPTGWTRDVLDQTHTPIRHILRSYDADAWPHATHGFFRFKDKIPQLVGTLQGLKTA